MTYRETMVGLADYAAQGRFFWEEPTIPGADRNSLAFGLIGGDPDFVCTAEQGTYVVGRRERGVLTPPLLTTNSLYEVDRYLSFAIGNSVRYRSGLPRLAFDLRAPLGAGMHGGYLVSRAPGTVTIAWNTSSGERYVSFLTDADASRFLLYSSFSVEDIRAAFLSESGSPLLG